MHLRLDFTDLTQNDPVTVHFQTCFRILLLVILGNCAQEMKILSFLTLWLNTVKHVTLDLCSVTRAVSKIVKFKAP